MKQVTGGRKFAEAGMSRLYHKPWGHQGEGAPCSVWAPSWWGWASLHGRSVYVGKKSCPKDVIAKGQDGPKLWEEGRSSYLR